MAEVTKFLFLDTNIWIDLAKEPNYIEQLKKIREIIDFTDFRLVLPDSVKIEFDRHRETIVNTWQKSLNSQVSNSYKFFKSLLPNREIEIKELWNDAQRVIKQGFGKIQTNLSFIDQLFSIAEVAPTSHFMSEAACRCLHHLPPALKSTRSSIGDCLLWLVAFDYLERGEVWF